MPDVISGRRLRRRDTAGVMEIAHVTRARPWARRLFLRLLSRGFDRRAAQRIARLSDRRADAVIAAQAVFKGLV
jgi:hypothetical protein